MVFVKHCDFSFSFLFRLKYVFGSVLDREIAYLHYKHIDLEKTQNFHFSNRDSPWFLSKVIKFLILPFKSN